jgi:Ca2+-transporting ATPase
LEIYGILKLNFSNNATVDDLGNVHGNATEVALMETLNAYQIADERKVRFFLSFKAVSRVKEIVFNHTSKFMAVEINHSDGPNIMYIKGALEAVLPKCKQILKSFPELIPMTENLRKQITLQEEILSNQGLRVIALAYGKSFNDYIFVGLIGMYDPPRMGIEQTIKQLLLAGIKFSMITGDSRKYYPNFSWYS